MTKMNLRLRIARKIKQVRRIHGLTQTHVSGKMKISQATLSKIENAEVDVGFFEWIRFCREFGVRVCLEDLK